MNDDFLPCPFCGGRASILKTYQEHDDGTYYSYACQECRAQTGESYARETCPIFYAELRDRWNARAALEPTPAQPVTVAEAAPLLLAHTQLAQIGTAVCKIAHARNHESAVEGDTLAVIRSALRALAQQEDVTDG